MAKKSPIILNKAKREITIQDLTISDSNIYDFLKDKQNLENWITKALIIGCIGLKQMVVTENVDFVEKEFNKFISKAATSQIRIERR